MPNETVSSSLKELLVIAKLSTSAKCYLCKYFANTTFIFVSNWYLKKAPHKKGVLKDLKSLFRSEYVSIIYSVLLY